MTLLQLCTVRKLGRTGVGWANLGRKGSSLSQREPKAIGQADPKGGA